MSGRMKNNMVNSCDININHKLSIWTQFSQILVTFVLLGDERPDFTGIQSKSNCALPATWSCNATGMVALSIDISNSTNIIISIKINFEKIFEKNFDPMKKYF